MFEEPLLFERSRPGRRGLSLATPEVPQADPADELEEDLLRDDVEGLPELSELDVVRHFTRLSQWNYGIDLGLFPLGSCTMKYNPRANERVAALPGLAQLHPLAPDADAQGVLALAAELEDALAAISGLDRVTLQPAAGAQGELVGMMMIQAHHRARGEPQRERVLIPDTAHGTNPASAALNGMEVVEVPSGPDGLLHPEALEPHLDERLSALMLTNPNTLGLFERHVEELSRRVHEAGGLVYLDGANLNALMGVARPGDMGVDVMHFNLHKTFSTPHGGGGPGSGPVAVREALAAHLPIPVIRRDGDALALDEDRPQSIGRVHAFLGNAGIWLRALAYVRALGAEGLAEVTRCAVLNANYLQASLSDVYARPHRQRVMHEVVFSDERQQPNGVTTADIAKRLMDYGYHPPTVYFPLVLSGALMVEPTETESLESLDEFVAAMRAIAGEAAESPETVTGAPTTPILRRLDEVGAARKPKLRWTPEG
ncbi:MAG: aminomethyl-transferring glycine dehydrogenase subunit GcvPB [Proteobacteria bacterium]|nr:aminomethyl-transferring glycine dehydrogenase subunit GcvPB [Pseudomonadota bacterium]